MKILSTLTDRRNHTAEFISMLMGYADLLQSRHWLSSINNTEHKLLEEAYNGLREFTDELTEFIINNELNQFNTATEIPELFDKYSSGFKSSAIIQAVITTIKTFGVYLNAQNNSELQSLIDDGLLKLNSIQYRLKIEKC